MCLENDIFVSECSEDMSLVNIGFNMYFGDDEAKALVIICDHVHFSHKNEGTSLLKGRGRGETNVTLISVTGNERSVSGLAFY